jgi:DNA processing protein
MRVDITNLIALKQIKGLSDKKIINLLTYFHNPNELFSSDLNEFIKFDYIDKPIYEQLTSMPEKNFGEISETVGRWRKNGIRIISYFDSSYPIKLKNISRPPLLLFFTGDIELLNKPSISIVGSRESSTRTLDWTYEISQILSKKGYTIISGGAKGVDAAAHKGALTVNGNTICVLGSGFDNVYPKENIQLIESIEKKGLVISEHLPEDRVNSISLLERNRITSGLGDAILIVSAKINGGTTYQTREAQKQNKKMFCPNPEKGLEPREGIVSLIKERKITVINNADDLISLIKKDDSQPRLLEYSEELLTS